MDGGNDLIRQALAAKDAQRRRLRQLSFPEKVKVVIHLQKIAAPILAARGKTVLVWPEDGASNPVPAARPAVRAVLRPAAKAGTAK
jgi:hypothetical protein